MHPCAALRYVHACVQDLILQRVESHPRDVWFRCFVAVALPGELMASSWPVWPRLVEASPQLAVLLRDHAGPYAPSAVPRPHAPLAPCAIHSPCSRCAVQALLYLSPCQ